MSATIKRSKTKGGRGTIPPMSKGKSRSMGTSSIQSRKSRKSLRMPAFGKTLKRKKKAHTVEEALIRKAEFALPPVPPGPINEEGAEELQFFVSTFNLAGVQGAIPADLLKFWLPPGYDIYCLCLQSVANMTEVGHHLFGYLESTGTKFQEYKHFVTLVDPETGKRTCLVTYLFIEANIVQSGLCTRTAFSSISFPKRVASKVETDAPFAGSFVVKFKVFDTEVQVANFQLTNGLRNAKLRRADLDFLLGTLRDRNDGVDHTFLAGDFGFTLIDQPNGCKLRDFVMTKSNIPMWSSDRFQGIVQEWDELQKYLRKTIPLLETFHESEISFPPTNHRKGFSVKKHNYERLALMFTPNYDLDNLFSYKSEDIPCYPDRILFSSPNPAVMSCIKAGRTGTCEGMAINDRVPVASSFRLAARSVVDEEILMSVEERAEIRKNYKASTEGLRKLKTKAKPRRTAARRIMREQSSADDQSHSEPTSKLVEQNLAEMGDEGKSKEGEQQDPVDPELLQQVVSKLTVAVDKLGIRDSVQGLNSAEFSYRDEEFVEDVRPPPPPPAPIEEVVEIKEETTDLEGILEAPKLELEATKLSHKTVHTEISQIADLGDELGKLVSMLDYSQEDVPPPPPPTESMLVREKKKGPRKLREVLEETMPEPPPSPMHGNFDNKSVMSSFQLTKNEKDDAPEF